MAMNLERLKRYDESFRHFEFLIKKNEFSPHERASTLNYYGYSLIELNRSTAEVEKGYKLVLEALRAAEGDKVRVRFNGAMKVIEILPLEGESYIYLIMPIQLKN